MQRALELAFEDSDSSDEDFGSRRPRWIRVREDHFNNFDDKDFTMRFRLSKQSVLFVLEQIENQLKHPTDKNCCVSPMNQLLCALRFYATGCFQTTVGDFCGISTSTAHRIIHRVSIALGSIWRNHIFFPRTQEEIRTAQMAFFNKAGFPRVIGAIDCTHIKLNNSPGGEHPEIFRNRKGFFSLNVQAICNANLEFIDIVARWPGSTHDSLIFNNCYRHAVFEQGVYGDAFLLGDGGYACKRYMMTPLENCNTVAEQAYNECHIRTRNSIERMFGIWKRRFPVMAIGLRVKLENIFPIITATAVLHNIARRHGEETPPDDDALVLSVPWDAILAEGQITDNGGRQRDNIHHRTRRILIENYFGQSS